MMVRIDRVVTRGGDGGETSLGDGSRVRKDAARIEAIGAVDEANSAIGLLRLHSSGETDAMLARIQNDLFDLGADLCVPGEGGDRLRLTDAPSVRLEAEVAAMNAGLPKLTSFVLPGGCPAAAAAHLARALVRRAERAVVQLGAEEPVGAPVRRFLNRLSDHLFVLARRLNAEAGGDVLWVPGANR
jgi:cob(I)alamin adenosyltransferase